MVAAQKGHLFAELRKRLEGEGHSFKESVESHGYCYVTCNNYINLYEMIDVYPSFQVSGITFTELILYRTMFIKHLQLDKDLDTFLRMPLRSFKYFCALETTTDLQKLHIH